MIQPRSDSINLIDLPLSTARARWLATYPWLELVADLARCKFCKTYNASNEYAIGITNPTNDKLKVHHASIGHANAMRYYLDDQTQKKLLENSNLNSNIEKIVIIPENLFPLFKGTLFLAREDIALYKSEAIYHLMDDLNVNVLKSYRNNHGASEILEAIASILEDDLLNKLKMTNFVGIQLDETTDIASIKQLSMYVTYFLDGKVTTEFLKLFEIKNGEAKTLYGTVSKYLQDNNIYGKLSSLCTDGAKAFCSKKEGLAGLLTRDIPKLVSLHCFAHRINLITGDLMEEFSDLKLVNSAVYSLCKFFKKSTKKLQILQDIEYKEIKSMKRLIKPIKVRWFSMYNAIKRIVEIYPSLVHALKEIKVFDANAVGVSLTITTFSFCFFCCFFSDILGVLNIMNKAFQKDNLKFSTVNMLISSIIRRIQQEFGTIERIKEGPILSEFLKEYNEKGTFQGFCFLTHLLKVF